ncbi:MAG TPA: nucleoside-diphosphate kinase [Anaerolineae bacterium]|nr:nucleoside-diphosphate kinase [Anaerolineae bacterium]MCB0223249.1 nucleoside-diphosphate kinase [Anaerolineae bacterium]HRV94840.1 nucleoside-diphosphate kinase [Anaerolineae bacterium]
MEKTLIIIKPDGVERGLIGPIISRFEQRGLKFIGMKLMQVSDELARQHYAIHEGKPFFEPLIQYITSSPVVVMALAGPDAIKIARNTIGATKPSEAAPGSIRGDFGMMVGRNLVHGSDSVENGELEIGLWFDESELTDYERSLEEWILEK